MNALYQVRCYKHNGYWVFDDPERGIVKEALIAGTDKAIDMLTLGIKHAKRGFVLTFSAEPFASFALMASYIERDAKSGYWYYFPYGGFPIWLCPVLDQYFPKPPAYLYASATEIKLPWWRDLGYRALNLIGL